MPTKFFEEMIGKECEITLRDDESEEGVIQAVDGDWIKLSDGYGSFVFINTKHIISICIDEERYDRPRRKR